MKVNKGDRVKYTGASWNIFGLGGTVVKDLNESMVAVRFDDDSEDYRYVYTDNIELIEEPYKSGLQEAQGLVYGDRNADYGHPFDDFDRTAKMWSAIIGTEVTAKQAALCMAAVKISREVNKPKRDNLVDLAGYAEVALRIQRKLDGEEPN